MITCKDNVAECFRIFIETSCLSPIPVRRFYTQGLNLNHNKVEAYIDGTCWNNGKVNTKCRGGVWISPNH